MGSDYQFPHPLSLINVREPSFSVYLTGDDRCRVVKLAELTRSKSEQNGRVSVYGEIDAFGADKYFNEGVKDHNMAAAFGPLSSGTQIIRPESNKHSQSALHHLVSTKVPGIQKKKTLLSAFSCKCSCANKKSIEVDDQHHKRVALKEPIRAGMNRADQLLEVSATSPRKPWMTDAKTSLLGQGPASPVSSESDASSDLFEIDSFTGNIIPSFSDQISDSGVSGYTTPTIYYAPRQASMDWSSVITASAADFSALL